jgi:hypothetical protein
MLFDYERQFNAAIFLRQDPIEWLNDFHTEYRTSLVRIFYVADQILVYQSSQLRTERVEYLTHLIQFLRVFVVN